MVVVKDVIAEFIQKQAVAGGILFIRADEKPLADRRHIVAGAQRHQLFDGAGGGLRLGRGRRFRGGLLHRGHRGAAQGAELLRVPCQVGAVHNLLIHFTILLAEAILAHSYPLFSYNIPSPCRRGKGVFRPFGGKRGDFVPFWGPKAETNGKKRRLPCKNGEKGLYCLVRPAGRRKDVTPWPPRPGT